MRLTDILSTDAATGRALLRVPGYPATIVLPCHERDVHAVGRSSVATIEGNSNDDGSREGWGVVKRPARKTAGLAFIRLPEAA